MECKIHHRILIGALGLCAAVTLSLVPAGASEEGGSLSGGTVSTSGRRTGSGAEASVGSSASPVSGSPSAGGGGGARQVRCTRNAIDPAAPLGTTGPEVGDLPEGVRYWRTCVDVASGARVSGPTLETAGPPALQGAALAAVLRDQALASLEVEVPVGRLSPPGATLPNFETWLWSDQPPTVGSSASAAGVTVSVSAVLVGTSFTFHPAADGVRSRDDGVTVRCEGPPQPYRPEVRISQQSSSCTYRFSGPTRDLTVGVSASWALSWSASTGDGGDLGTIERSASVPYRVQAKATVIRTPR